MATTSAGNLPGNAKMASPSISVLTSEISASEGKLRPESRMRFLRLVRLNSFGSVTDFLFGFLTAFFLEATALRTSATVTLPPSPGFSVAASIPFLAASAVAASVTGGAGVAACVAPLRPTFGAGFGVGVGVGVGATSASGAAGGAGVARYLSANSACWFRYLAYSHAVLVMSR